MLITDPIDFSAYHHPQKIAIVTAQATVTYAELSASINQTANALLALTNSDAVSEQKKVAVLLDNSLELLQVFLAAAKIGWLSLIFDPKWTVKDLNVLLAEIRPGILVIHDTYQGRIEQSAEQTHVIVVPTSGETASVEPTREFSQWLQSYSSAEPAMQAQEEDTFYVGYTSGTTGKPKGFVRTHRSWVESFRMSNAAFRIDADHHVLAPGPLVHSLSLYAATATLFAGATVHIVQKFTAQNVLDVIFAQSITDLYVVPTMFEALYEESLKRSQSQATTSSVRGIISTGDKWSALSKQKVKMVFPGASLFEFYGASELSFVTILDPDGNQRRPDSVGKPVENVTISIRDAEGKEVQRGEAGTLYVQSPMLFAGYYMGSAIASESNENGWATVGDIAKQDEEGFVYIVGRKNNMLISGGLNIYPQEIEEVLVQIPSIHEALVIGVPDTHWGEKIVALVKLKPEATLEEDTVKMYCRDHLAIYKCPKEIRQVEAFSYTQSGKIARQVMREQFIWGQTNHE